MKPLDKRVEELEAKLAQTQRELLRKPSREAMPLAPRHGRYVGKTNADLAPGGVVDVTVWIHTAGDWDDTTVVIEDVEEFFLQPGQELTSGSRVYCFYYETRWVLFPLGYEGLVRFELTGTLALSGDASAILLADNGADYADTANEIQVYDWFASEGMWAGIAGYRGYALRREGVHASGRQKYDIVWMEQIAQTIQFTSTEYMGNTTAGRMAVTVNWYDHQGKEPVGTVIVRDSQSQFPDVHSGAKGTAVYDYHNGYYRVVACQRVALFASATLNGNQCPSSSLNITSFAHSSVGDYVGAPPTTPTTASGFQAGMSGDAVKLRRTNNTMPNPAWEVVEIATHVIQYMTGLRVDGLTLQYKTRDVYVQYCSTTESSWTTWHTGDDCDP